MAAMYKFMPKSNAESVMFKGDEDTFESLFDNLCVSEAQPETGRQTSSRWNKERPQCHRGGCIEQGRKVRVWQSKGVAWCGCNNTGHLSGDCHHNKDKSNGGGNHVARDSTSNKGHKSGGTGKCEGNTKGKGKNINMQSVESDRKEDELRETTGWQWQEPQ